MDLRKKTTLTRQCLGVLVCVFGVLTSQSAYANPTVRALRQIWTQEGSPDDESFRSFFQNYVSSSVLDEAIAFADTVKPIDAITLEQLARIDDDDGDFAGVVFDEIATDPRPNSRPFHNEIVSSFGGLTIGERLDVEREEMTESNSLAIRGANPFVYELKLTDGDGVTIVRVNGDYEITAILSSEEVEFPVRLVPDIKLRRIEKIYGDFRYRRTRQLSDGKIFVFYPNNKIGFFLDALGTRSVSVLIRR